MCLFVVGIILFLSDAICLNKHHKGDSKNVTNKQSDLSVISVKNTSKFLVFLTSL